MEMFDEGKPYYFNAVMRDEPPVWARPEGCLVISEATFDALDAEGVALGRLLAEAAALSTEWEAVIDSDSGERYWYSARRGESQWENPFTAAAASAPTTAAGA